MKRKRNITLRRKKMMKRIFQAMGFSSLLVLVLFSLSNGSSFIENREKPFSFQKTLAQDDFKQSQKLFNLTHTSYFAFENDPAKEKQSTDVYGFKGKSLKKAFLYSLIVPGSGEFYAGSKIKAGLFFGLDVTLWALYFDYHGKGKDKENEYKAWADQFWAFADYRQWLWDSVYHEDPKIGYENVSDTFPYYKNGVKTYFSHHLHDKKDQQYYEMLGKYEQFGNGWDDYSDASQTSAHREKYLNMRFSSNNLLNKAKYSAMFSLANHILSSFDAAFAVKRYNKKGERFSQVEFKMRLSERDNEVIPRLSVSMRF
jgi:hypothetical protein